MFVKRNKSRPSLRARDTDDELLPGSPLAQTASQSGAGADNGEVEDAGGSVMERKKAKSKEKKSLNKPTRLSFGGDNAEEGDATPFKPRKSLLSQSIKLSNTPSSEAPSSRNGSPSVYSKEYLTQLKASTPSKAPQRASVQDGEEEDDGSGLSRLAREKYASTLVEDTTAGIPDAAAIAAARSKRQAKVEGAKHDLGDDYIALGNGQIAVYDGDKGPHPESRLMREEDEMDEGDEDLADYTEANEKVYLGRNANKAAARRMRGEIGELIDDREAEEEDDEDTREWEEAQVRRAGRLEPEQETKTIKRGHTPVPIPVARPIPTIGPASARLTQSLAEMKMTQSEAEHNLEVNSQELAHLDGTEQDLRKEVELIEGKREWVDGFRQWVDTLGEFLEEKYPKLENIEADALHHLEQRAEIVKQRRINDDSDDLALFLGSAPLPESDEVDEMGRSRENEAGPSNAVRRARRSERDSRRLRRRVSKPQQEEDGFSTDSSLGAGDAEDYNSAQKQLERRVHGLLEDVRAEDLRDPTKGLAVRFGEWRQKYEEEYMNAFGGLAMLQAWEFWVRGEMVGWEPLRDATPLESFSWFTALHEYSNFKPEGIDHDLEEDFVGPDGDLAAEMVSKAIVPLLVKAFEAGAYDPYSAHQTRRALDLVEVVQELSGRNSKKFTALLKAILGVFHNHLIDLSTQISSCFGPDALPAPSFDPASRTAMQRFVRKRLKLIRNILLWRRQAPAEVKELVNRAISDVVRPVLTKTWDGGGKEMGEKVLALTSNELRPDLATFLRTGPVASRW